MALEQVKLDNQGEKNKEEVDIDLDEIKRKGLDLLHRVQSAKKQHEKSIPEKLEQREGLISEAAQNQTILNQARETLNYFDSLEKENIELGEEDSKQLEELRETVPALEMRGEELNKMIAALEKAPEIISAVREEAEGKESEIKKEHAKFKEEVDAKVLDLNKDFEILSQKKSARFNAEKDYFDIRSSVRNVVDGQIHKLKDDEMEKQWAALSNKQDLTGQEILAMLQEARAKLGLFDRTKKNILDELINKPESFTALDEAKKVYEKASADLETGTANYDTKLKEAITRAWEYQNIIDDHNQHKVHFGDLSARLYHDVQKFNEDKDNYLFIELKKKNFYSDLAYQNPRDVKDKK